jgi:4-hydroxy-tetrahydrodipicolinate synthase
VKENNKFNGLWPVMLTPFRKNKSIDYKALEQLTEFYLAKGATGLFANCLSSEMYELTETERISLVKHVVNRVNGRVPVAATVTFGGSFARQIDFSKKVRDEGADVNVIITSQLAGATKSNAELQDRILEFARRMPDVLFGLYECPVPYKRILPAGMVRQLAKTERFAYLKDTTCDTRLIADKVSAVNGTGLSLFNANTPTAIESLKAGADGLSPISANFYPELYSWVIKNVKKKARSENIEFLNDQLTMMDAITRINYPMSAKFFLARRGLPIEPVIRTKGSPLNYEESKIIDKLFDNFMKIAGDFLVY